MTTQIQGAVIDHSLPAGADLSGNQFYFVKVSAGTYVLCDAVTDVPKGVLQNKPEAGKAAEVRIFGPTKLWAGGTVGADDLLGTDTAAKAVKQTPGTDTTHYIVARAIEAGVADRVFSAVVNCVSPARAA